MRLFAGTPWDRPPLCDRCGQLDSSCRCPPAVAPPSAPETQVARMSCEQRRRGKVVTIIQGLTDSGNHLPDLLRQLKSACGAGGALKNGVLEIQGAHVERLRETLRALGYRVPP